jgi:hypothetical protein
MRTRLSTCLRWIAVIGIAALPAGAGATIVTFSGNTSLAIGGIPGNTPFTGTFTYNSAASGVTTSFNGGTETIYSNGYSGLTLTIGGSTVSETVPGAIALFNNLTAPGSGAGLGDSFFTFDPASGPNPSTGEFLSYGLTPDYIYLSFADTTGNAFSGANLPLTLNLAEFTLAGVGIDSGPLGAGNTSTISSLTALKTLPDQSYTAWLLLCALGLLIAVKRTATVAR